MAEQTKVILWSYPRTVSSTFVKCMSNVPDSKMLFEMYTAARFYGPEGMFFDKKSQTPSASEVAQADPGSGFNSSICTYEWLKHHLETGYPDNKFVFSKELTFCIAGKFDYIPDSGYRHAFLIRNPAKVLPSWHLVVTEMITLMAKQGKMPATADISKISFERASSFIQATCDLYSHIKDKGLDPDPVIIDSDDLLNDPEGVLSRFCQKMGIPYSDALLRWEPGVEVVEDWTVSQELLNNLKYTETCKNFRKHPCFLKPKPKADPEVSAEMQNLIDISMPYYTQMYEKRMK
ncbi:uncharacterized protein [Asterias amurensis]|uniref:uncharacterized protein n=1 Tax=Asterias amurensis TaxID=7602 RepID=UPI003AB79763